MTGKHVKSGFFGPVLTIMSGSTLAQLIPLLTEPILARLFTPMEFGILALFLAVATIFASVATGRYEMAVVLPSKDEDAINLLALSLIITIFMTMLSGLVVIFFGENIASWAGNSDLISFLRWVPLFVFISGLFQTFNQWATRKKSYRNIAASKITQSSTNGAVSIGTGYALWGSIGLIFGQIAGWFMGFVPLFVKFWRNDRNLLSLIRKSEVKRLAQIYSDFPRINSMHVLTDIGQQSLVNFIISRFYSGEILGFYSRMIRIVKVPAGFIGAAVGQVFYQKASEQWQKDQNIRSLLTNQMKIVGIFGLPIFIIPALFGPQIFGFVLGEAWMVAGQYAQLLSPWLLLNFLISPFSYIPLIVNRQKRFFMLSLVMNILVILAFLSGYLMKEDIFFSLILLTIIQVVFHLYLGWWFYKISKA
jgi:O-antigen/teichoic acid export membrane protein